MSDETTGLLTAAERSACVAYLASTETSEQLRLVFRFASDRMGIAATIDTIHLVLRLDDHARALLAAAEARGVARGHADEWQRAVRICDRYAREYGHAVAAEIADAIRAGRTTPPATGATEGAAHDWPEDAGHENGQYQNKCVECDAEFIGHKRRVVCRKCTTTTTPPATGAREDSNG